MRVLMLCTGGVNQALKTITELYGNAFEFSEWHKNVKWHLAWYRWLPSMTLLWQRIILRKFPVLHDVSIEYHFCGLLAPNIHHVSEPEWGLKRQSYYRFSATGGHKFMACRKGAQWECLYLFLALQYLLMQAYRARPSWWILHDKEYATVRRNGNMFSWSSYCW